MNQEAGFPMIWIVAPEKTTITVIATGRPATALKLGDTLDGGEVLPGFRVPVAKMFGEE